MTNTDTTGYGTLLLRLVLGGAFIPHALLKLLVFTPAGTALFFSSVGVPGALAWPVILLELVGALALITGVATRIFALLLAADLLGAIVTVHLGNGFFFTDPNGGWEYPALWMLALLALALQGDGAFSLGRLIAVRPRGAAQAA